MSGVRAKTWLAVARGRSGNSPGYPLQMASVMVGVVLGAGSSSRLGRPKQTLPLGDSTVLGWAVRAAERSTLDRVVLVVGGAADEALSGLELDRAEVARNDAYGEGCASSLLAGLAAAGDCDAVMLLLGDVPGLGSQTIDASRAAWDELQPWGLVTEYDDGPGHPFVFSADAFDALRALHGDKAVWKLLDVEGAHVQRARVSSMRPQDVDTWEDYEAVRAALPA
jgi:molybdenum cofactor cytidylyltransferase